MGSILIDRIEGIIHNSAELRHFVHVAERTIRETGNLPDTPAWRLIEHRHEIAPKRFDHYHEWSRPIWRLLAEEHPVPVVPMPPVVGPPIGPGGISEPSTIAMLPIAIAFVFVFRRLVK